VAVAANFQIKALGCGLALIFFCAALRLSTLITSHVATPGVWTWREISFELPKSIRVFEGKSAGASGEAFTVWRVDMDSSDKDLRFLPFVSSDASGREPASVQAQKAGALVAVNGGYFDMAGSPAKTYSLVLQNGKVLRENIGLVMRGARQYFVTRSALCIDKNGKLSIAWIHHHNGKIYQFENPLSFVAGKDAPAVEYANEWNVENAIGGGPRLIQNGQERITYDEEVFLGAGFPNEANYSRCAVGFTRSNKLIFLVTDSNPPENTGLSLHQVAQMFLQLGCVEAINLDGGGSETLVVNGKVLNRPSDGSERPVTSIFAVTPASR
jgi:exopolysaccharide biosynthesis protein